MNNKKLRLVLVGFACAASSFVGGFYAATAAHGDWIPIRSNEGACGAYDMKSRKVVGYWQPRHDGVCHISDYIIQKWLP